MQVTINFPNVPNTTHSVTFRVKELDGLRNLVLRYIQAWSTAYNHPIDLLTTHRITRELTSEARLNIHILKISPPAPAAV